MKVLLTLLIIIFSFNQVQAKELCDYYGSCININPRDVSQEIKNKIKIRDGYNISDKVDIDHILPLCLGGTNDESNLQALPPEIHKIKTQNDVLLLYYVENGFMTIEEAQQEELKRRNTFNN